MRATARLRLIVALAPWFLMVAALLVAAQTDALPVIAASALKVSWWVGLAVIVGWFFSRLDDRS